MLACWNFEDWDGKVFCINGSQAQVSPKQAKSLHRDGAELTVVAKLESFRGW